MLAPELKDKPLIKESYSVTEIKHTFWIKLKQEKSNLDYKLSQKEILMAATDAFEPNIKIIGSLVLKSSKSIPKCFVKLPNNYLEAVNELGQKMLIDVKGQIGSKILSTEFIKPSFDEYNEVPFVLEGYIRPESLKHELKPGKYTYKEDLKLTIEFKD